MAIFKIILFLSLGLFGCQLEGKKEKEKNQEAIPVRVEKVTLRSLQKTLEYVGNVKAQDEAIVYPKVSGKIIEKIKEDGSFVNKGEVIAYIDRDEVGLKFENAPIETPLTGIVGRVYVDLGTNVTLSTPIALIVDMERVKIDLEIPQIYLPKVFLGQKAVMSVDAYPEEEFFGEVSKISPVVDPTTRTAPLEIIVDNPQHRLKSGMFAKVSLVIQENQNIPVILKEAVIVRDTQTYVYVIENKKAVLRKITLGIRQGPYYEIKEGLREGDSVVIMGQERLYEGAPVIAEEEKR